MGRVRLGRWSRSHPRRSRNPQRPFSAALPPPDFAALCETALRNTVVSTSSTTTYINAVTLPVGLIPAGDYWLEVFAYYSNENVFEGDCQMQLTQNGAEIANNRGHSNGSGIGAQDAKNLFANARILTLAQAAYTFDLNFRVGSPNSPGDEAAVFWSRLSLWSF